MSILTVLLSISAYDTIVEATMTTLYCAECERRFEPDDDHTRLNAELRRVDDRNKQEMYVLCPDCWHQISDGWVDPA